MPFDDRLYTEDAVIKQLALVELHSKDGSALDAGCSCIEGKHLFIIEGLSNEGVGFTKEIKEKQFYEQLGSLARSLRRTMEHTEFDMTGALHEAGLNPSVSHAKLHSCIEQAEIHCCGGPTKHYENCSCNPVAVCRASVEH